MANDSDNIIVVVDDSPTVRTLFERCSDGLPVDLKIFESANTSWEYLQEHKPALLFLNIKMPGRDGLTFLKELRELNLHKDTAVVMISSKDYTQDRNIAEELGALDFIIKPMPMSVIKETIVKYTNLSDA